MHRLASYIRQRVYPLNELEKYYQAGPKFIALLDILFVLKLGFDFAKCSFSFLCLKNLKGFDLIVRENGC